MQLTKCSKDILKLLQIMELCEDRELIALVLKKLEVLSDSGNRIIYMSVKPLLLLAFDSNCIQDLSSTQAKNSISSRHYNP